jgi:hypothetical protein
MERMKSMLVVLDKMTPENGQTYLDGWLEYVNQAPPPLAESPLFDRKIGEVLGPVVVGKRTGTSWDMARANNAVREQFLGWMTVDPAAAKAWMDGLKNEEFRERLVDEYVSGIAQKDVSGALTFLKTLPEDLHGPSAEAIVAAVKAEKSQEELGLWLNNLAAGAGEEKDAAWLRSVSNALMQNLANGRMVGAPAAAIFEQHRGQPYMESSWGGTLAQAYARSDTPAGLAWAAGFSDDANMLQSAIRGVPPEKFDDAIQWAQSPGAGNARDSVLNGIADRLQSGDPAKAEQVRALVNSPP